MSNSLNDLQLDNQLLASLYKNVLVADLNQGNPDSVTASAPTTRATTTASKTKTTSIPNPTIPTTSTIPTSTIQNPTITIPPSTPKKDQKTEAPQLRPATSPIKYLGNNEKQITILVSYTGHTFLPEDALAFLTKILHACQLNLSDIAIINTEQEKSWQNAKNTLPTQKQLSFGPTIPSTKPAYFIIESVDNILCLNAPPLDEFITESEQAKQLKTKLWSCLKQLFQIK